MSDTNTLDARMEEEPRGENTLVAHLMPQVESIEGFEKHEDYREAVNDNLEYYEVIGAKAALVFDYNKRINSNFLVGFMKDQLISDGDFYLLNNPCISKIMPRLKDDLNEAGQDEVYIFYQDGILDDLDKALESEGFEVKYKE